MVYESPRAPHMSGRALHAGDVEAAISYNIAMVPEPAGLRLPGQRTAGGAIARHTVDARLSLAITTPEEPTQRAWEFGLNLGFSHQSLAGAQSSDFYLSAPNEVYVRAGVGLRGPVFERNKFALGLGFELDFASLPYRVEVIRNTQQIAQVVGVDPLTPVIAGLLAGVRVPVRFYEYNGERYEIESDIATGHTFFPMVRGGLYASYDFNQYVSLSFGTSFQNSPAVQGTVTQSYTCTNVEYSLGEVSAPTEAEYRKLAQECRKEKGEDYPVLRHAFAMTLYSGLHISVHDLTFTFRAQSSFVFQEASAYGAPIAGDFEVAYRF